MTNRRDGLIRSLQERSNVDTWRALPESQWGVAAETSRLLKHWRHHTVSGVHPFFCQIEAVETAIWLTEVAPHAKAGSVLLAHLTAANRDANPELQRLALKLATGAGKTTVMAMLIEWQTLNAVRRPGSKQFTRGFFIVAPGLTIKDRLRVLQPNLDSDWEAEVCRIVEAHPQVLAYTKNHSLGLEVPYRFESEARRYFPDIIVLVDDGRGADDLLHLVIEVKGYRREDAKVKKATMNTYWIPGVNQLQTYGRWAFEEFTDMHTMAAEFDAILATGRLESPPAVV